MINYHDLIYQDQMKNQYSETVSKKIEAVLENSAKSDGGLKRLKFKKKRSIFVDMGLTMMVMAGLWSGSHVAINWGAYSQIFAYKVDNLSASVIDQEDVASMAAENRTSTIDPTIKQALKTETVKTEKSFFSLAYLRKPEIALEQVPEQTVTFRQKELKPRHQAKQVFDMMPVYPADNRVYLPRINKNVPLVSVPTHTNWNQLENYIQDGLRRGVVVHPVSHDPGNFGNFFLTGHSSYYTWDPGRYKDVFALLHEVEVGDLVEVFWEGKRYVYKIKEKEIVPPTAVEVLRQPKDKKLVTLMTCTPVGTNKNRLILIGELKE